MTLFGSSIVIVLIGVAAYAAAGPIQLQAGPNTLQRDEYGPLGLTDFLARPWEDRSLSGSHLWRSQGRRGLDSLSGTTFGESKRFIPFRRAIAINERPGYFDEIDRSVFDHFSKRNIDEIDTSFDNFFKRNFDEIDSSFGFVKRLNNYLANKQRH
ncbi:hypothetical protein P5V15_004766 [Pogonomyrmex californicus]